MAKLLTISKDSKPDDGFFEVVIFRHNRKARLIKKLVRASVTGLDTPTKSKNYQFSVIKDMSAQLDGEVIKLLKSSNITITSEKQVLRTLV
jgi:diacylglycerol kinase family enzyme